MKLNICMLLPLYYKPNMQVDPTIGVSSYLSNFGHSVTWVIWSEESHRVQSFPFNDVHVYTVPYARYFPGSSLLSTILNFIPNTLGRMSIILKIFKEGNYNLIFVRGSALFDNLVAAYIKKRYKITFVYQLDSPIG